MIFAKVIEKKIKQQKHMHIIFQKSDILLEE